MKCEFCDEDYHNCICDILQKRKKRRLARAKDQKEEK